MPLVRGASFGAFAALDRSFTDLHYHAKRQPIRRSLESKPEQIDTGLRGSETLSVLICHGSRVCYYDRLLPRQIIQGNRFLVL
jgi:hypothetical protein